MENYIRIIWVHIEMFLRSLLNLVSRLLRERPAMKAVQQKCPFNLIIAHNIWGAYGKIKHFSTNAYSSNNLSDAIHMYMNWNCHFDVFFLVISANASQENIWEHKVSCVMKEHHLSINCPLCPDMESLSQLNSWTQAFLKCFLVQTIWDIHISKDRNCVFMPFHSYFYLGEHLRSS